jgi:hypothetical protein
MQSISGQIAKVISAACGDARCCGSICEQMNVYGACRDHGIDDAFVDQLTDRFLGAGCRKKSGQENTDDQEEAFHPACRKAAPLRVNEKAARD